MTPGVPQPGGAVRSGRSRRRGATVAVTGAASGTGRRLAAHLAGCEDVRRVVAIDDQRGDLGLLPPGAGQRVTWRVVDVCDPALVGRLRGVDALVHCAADLSVGGDAVQRSRHAVRGTQTVLTAAAATGVRRVVLCTSAMVYGAVPDNPVPLDEDAPLRALPDGDVIGDLLEVEALAARSRRSHPGLQVTVVRPATVVGDGADSVLTRHFESPRLLVVRDSHPRWQFCHVEDLANALAVAALAYDDEAPEALTVACEGWLSQDEIEELSGRRRMELPGTLAFATAERLYRLGVLPAPATELQYVVHPWVVSSARLRAAGWRPAYDNAATFRLLLDQVSGHHAVGARRITRTDGVVGAAGATVAVLGTAAMVRRARKRRGRA
jgi:nucleoside-diphosphate-sugar epimerase